LMLFLTFLTWQRSKMLKNKIILFFLLKKEELLKVKISLSLKMLEIQWSRQKIYSDSGADEIWFFDITASNENRETI
jgi:Imidazoleglycerol-phosphate synthase